MSSWASGDKKPVYALTYEEWKAAQEREAQEVAEAAEAKARAAEAEAEALALEKAKAEARALLGLPEPKPKREPVSKDPRSWGPWCLRCGAGATRGLWCKAHVVSGLAPVRKAQA